MRSATALLVAALAATAVVGPPASAEPQVDIIRRDLRQPLHVQGVPGGVIVNDIVGEDPATATSSLVYVDDRGRPNEIVYEDGIISGHDHAQPLGFTVFAYTLLTERGSYLRVTSPAAGDNGGETLADLAAHETRHNPDGEQSYGIKSLRGCDVPRRFRPYRGVVDSNPYAVAAAADGGWFVADAGANAVLHVSDTGDVDTVTVLPAQRYRIDRAAARDLGLRRCAVGKTLRHEPVPTDVEQAADGTLYVTLLPGGEGPAIARGKLLNVDPDDERVRTVATGFRGASNLALAPGGVFVAELYGDRITAVDRVTGEKSLYSLQDTPTALDWFDGALYATVRALQPEAGKLVKLTDVT